MPGAIEMLLTDGVFEDATIPYPYLFQIIWHFFSEHWIFIMQYKNTSFQRNNERIFIKHIISQIIAFTFGKINLLLQKGENLLGEKK